MKRALLLVSMLVATLVAGASAPALATVDSDKNQTDYWEEQFDRPDRLNLTCVKFEDPATPWVSPSFFNRVIVKAGSNQSVEKPHEVLFNVKKGQKVAHYSGKENSHIIACRWTKEKKKKPVLNYGGRILGPCGDPYYTARIWNGKRSTRPVAIVLEIRNGPTLWKRVLQPGESKKPKAKWVRGGRFLVLRRGNGDIIDTERTVTGTYPWTECRKG